MLVSELAYFCSFSEPEAAATQQAHKAADLLLELSDDAVRTRALLLQSTGWRQHGDLSSEALDLHCLDI